VIENLGKGEILSFLSSKIPRAMVSSMKEMDGEDAEYGWSFAFWPENVVPRSGEGGADSMGLLSIPYYTYHVLDTYATALFDKEITEDKSVSRFYKKMMVRVLKWIENTFLQEGEEGVPDITREEIDLNKCGFYNALISDLNLFNNVYVLGSWISAALCLQRVIEECPPEFFSMKERIRNGLLFLAEQSLEPKYKYSETDRNFPEFAFRLAGTHWHEKVEKSAEEDKLHSKLFQDRALHPHCLKALVRYLRLFPEEAKKDKEIIGAINKVGKYLMKLTRGSDARGPSLWQPEGYSFFYTNRATGAISELGMLVFEHPDLDKNISIEAQAVVTHAEETSNIESIIQKQLSRAFVNLSKALGTDMEQIEQMVIEQIDSKKVYNQVHQTVQKKFLEVAGQLDTFREDYAAFKIETVAGIKTIQNDLLKLAEEMDIELEPTSVD